MSGCQCEQSPRICLSAHGFISILHACNWAQATAGSRDANDMLIRKLGSNSSLALAGHRQTWSCISPHRGLLHPNPLWGPVSRPTTGSCVPPFPGFCFPPHCRILHSTPLLASASDPTNGVLHPTPLWGSAQDPTLPQALPAPSSIPRHGYPRLCRGSGPR